VLDGIVHGQPYVAVYSHTLSQNQKFFPFDTFTLQIAGIHHATCRTRPHAEELLTQTANTTTRKQLMTTSGSATYTQIGTELSLFSGKTRAYLLHKRIPFVERGSNPWEFFYSIPKHTNCAVVPVVITPEGQWLQDTSVIIDTLEQRFPENPVLPATPVLRFAAYLFELWGDEYWLPLAMHTRWSHAEETIPLFVRDAGDALLPGFPRWLKNKIAGRHARLMQSHAVNLGVSPEMHPVLDAFLQTQLDALDAHFSQHRFLFGNRPSLGDYGLIAPLYAHLGRDPWSKRELIAPRRHLSAWIERMFQPETSVGGEFWAEDALPESLTPMLRSIFDDMLPFLAACAEEVRKLPVQPADSKQAPRFLEPVSYPMNGGTHRRPALSFPVWMAQRMLEALANMSPADQQTVRTWLDSVGGEGVLQLNLPKVQRVGLAAAHIA
jgi:glutathione S-transferase